MGELTTQCNEVLKQENEETEVLYGKVLDIKSSTLGIDYKDVLHKVCQYVNIADIAHKVKKGAEFVVQIPAEFQGGFDAGDYWVMENSKTGKLWPTLMELGDDGRNHIVTPLAVKKQEFTEGNPARDITANYHNLYMQQQINELSNLIETTLAAVQRVELGLKDDRIGLLEAGKQGVILALSQKDEAEMKNEIRNARNNINIAQNQIAETFKTKVHSFEALPKTKAGVFIKEPVKTGYIDSKDSEYDEIQDYFELYIQSTRMLAASYVLMGDEENAEKVFNLAAQKMRSIDYSNLASLKITHSSSDTFVLDSNAPEFLIAEKDYCMNEAKDYDCLAVHITGEELLEVIENDRKISEEETK